MPPLIVFIMGIISVILFMTVPVWLAVMIVAVLVFTCLFRIRHLGRFRRHGGGIPQSDSFWSFLWLNSNNPDGANPPPGEVGHHHHHHGHHHPDGSAPDAASGGHSHHHHDSSSSGGGHHGGFDGGGGHHGGGGDFGGGGHH